MERLTARTENGDVYIPECFKRCDGEGTSEKCRECDIEHALVYSLAAYEDTDLTSEKIEEMSDMYLEKCEEVNRLRAELAKAEPYIRLAEKMNLCDLVAENQRLANELILRNAELLECKETIKRMESEQNG